MKRKITTFCLFVLLCSNINAQMSWIDNIKEQYVVSGEYPPSHTSHKTTPEPREVTTPLRELDTDFMNLLE